jgi:hypothetical protein
MRKSPVSLLVEALEKHLMIVRRFARFGMLLVVGVLLCVGQPAEAAVLGDNIRTASNVQPFANQIQGYVKERIGQLGGDDPVLQSQARQDLVSEVIATPGGAAPSAAFLTYYATLLNTELAPLAQSKNTRVRLNAAIVAAKVAEGARNAALLPVTQTLLKDPSDAVVLWALRAAKQVLPHALAPGAQGGDQLVATIVQIGQARPRVVTDVYDSLAISQAAAGRVQAAVVPAVHTVMRSRLNQYTNSIPQEPIAEARGANFLTGRQDYASQTPAQKVETVQLVSDLLGVIAQRSTNASSDQRRELVHAVRGLAGAMYVVGQWENHTVLQATAQPAARLPLNASATEIQTAVQPIYGALRGIARFKEVKPPPQVGELRDMASTAPPATTTSPAGR